MYEEYDIGDLLGWNLIDKPFNQATSVSSHTFNCTDPTAEEFLILMKLTIPSNSNARTLYLKPNSSATNTAWTSIEKAEGGSVTGYDGNSAGFPMGNFNANYEGYIYGQYQYNSFKGNGNILEHSINGFRQEHRNNQYIIVQLGGRVTSNPSAISTFKFEMTAGTFNGKISIFKKAPTW